MSQDRDPDGCAECRPLPKSVHSWTCAICGVGLCSQACWFKHTAKCLERRSRAQAPLWDALRALVDLVEETRDDSEGRWPRANAGCIDCTVGTVPDRPNTGRCAYHVAVRLLEGRD